MSVQPEQEKQYFSTQDSQSDFNKKVNVNDLMSRMNETKKQEKKN